MSETLKRVEEMRQGAIALLLEERELINEKLAQLGFENGPNGEAKRRGRPPRPKAPDETTGAVENAVLQATP